MRASPARNRLLNRAMAPVWALLLGAGWSSRTSGLHRHRHRRGGGWKMGHFALHDAHKSRPPGPSARRKRVDRGRLGQRRDGDHLSRGLVEPPDGRHYDADPRLGHVLQWHRCAAGRPCVHQRRQPAVRPLLWRAPLGRLRSSNRPLQRFAVDGARTVVPDRHRAGRRSHDDAFGVKRNRWHEYVRRDLHAWRRLEPGVFPPPTAGYRRCTPVCTWYRTAACFTPGRASVRGSSTPRPKHGRAARPPRFREITAHQSCYRSRQTTGIARA